MTYFFIIFLAAFVFSLVFSIWVTRKVAGSYRALFDQDLDKAKKIESLRYFDQWQIIAKKLAHEIKNPLTPILVMVTSLTKFFEKGDEEKFAKQLHKTEQVVVEEVEKLRSMVHHFTQYSKMPDPVTQTVPIHTYISDFAGEASLAWPDIQLDTEFACDENLTLCFDPVLIKQCLQNIVGNAVEANAEQAISVRVTVKKQDENICIDIVNTGATIPVDQIDKLFTLYFSTKTAKENMGLGLAIVKKILLDHGGDAYCEPQESGAKFVLMLPVTNKKES